MSSVTNRSMPEELGTRSMIMEKVSHKFAKANQEKTRLIRLYCADELQTQMFTHYGLNMEHEHATDQ